MLRWGLRVAALSGGLFLMRATPAPWDFVGLAILVLVVLGWLGIGRTPVREWDPGDAQAVTIVAAGPRHIDVIKVLREYMDTSDAATLKAQLESASATVGQVPSEAAAADLAHRLEPLETTVSFHPVVLGN